MDPENELKMPPPVGYIEVAKVLRAQGMRGELKLLPYTRTPEDLCKYQFICLEDKNLAFQEYPLLSSRITGQYVIARFKGVETRDQAEALQGSVFYIHEDQLPTLPEHEYYLRDLLGFDVITTEGNRIGVITEILELPAHDVYQVQGEERDWLIPAISQVVIKILPESRTIIINLLEGLEDI